MHQQQVSGGHATLAFSGECTIYQAAALHQQLTALFGVAQVVSLDISTVGEVDAAFLQLLLSSRMQARHSSITLHFSEPSASLLQLLDSLYCRSLLTDVETADKPPSEDASTVSADAEENPNES